MGKLVFDHFCSFMGKIGVKGHIFVVSEVEIGQVLFSKSHGISTGKPFEVKNLVGEVIFEEISPVHAEHQGKSHIFGV